MAETPDIDKLARRDPDARAADPIVSRSTSAILLVSALLLTVVLAWSLYDEVYGMRPWKSYQQSFVKRYDRYLKRLQKRGWVASRWGQSPTGRRARYYTITAAGRRQLGDVISSFDRVLLAINRVMRRA